MTQFDSINTSTATDAPNFDELMKVRRRYRERSRRIASAFVMTPEELAVVRRAFKPMHPRADEMIQITGIISGIEHVCAETLEGATRAIWSFGLSGKLCLPLGKFADELRMLELGIRGYQP